MDFTPNPVAFTVFGIDIMWYAVLICAGALLASFITIKRAPSRGLKPDDIIDCILVALPAGIVGARLWYVFFNKAYYHTFFDVINIRAGGLAIQGGLIFGFAAALLMCRHKRISFLNAVDTAVPSIALAQAIGRWGNFFNQEAHGTETDLPWAITVDGIKVHPTFLYESIWCLLLFILLSYTDRRKKYHGETLCLYCILYSAERFFVEQLRTDSLLAGPDSTVVALQEAGYDPGAVEGVVHVGGFLIFPFRTAQFICIISIVLALVLMQYFKKRFRKNDMLSYFLDPYTASTVNSYEQYAIEQTEETLVNELSHFGNGESLNRNGSSDLQE